MQKKPRFIGTLQVVLFLSILSFICSIGYCDPQPSQNLGDLNYFNARYSVNWVDTDKKDAISGKWTQFLGGSFCLTDIKNGGKPEALSGDFKRSGDNLLFSGKLENLGLVLEAVFIPHPDYVEVVGRVKDTTGVDRAVRAEYSLNLDAIGWDWWDDIRNVRMIKGEEQYSNTSSVFVGTTGQMSRYPYSCIASDKEAISYGIPLDRPRIFQINYDAKNKKYNIGFDFVLSKKTEKFPSEATFFFILYNPDPQWGFRAATDAYYRIYPSFFEKKVEREGIWMPFTLINSVENPQDFCFAFDEYGAVDIRYNTKHGIYSFLYTEPWTYWMPMDPNTPRDYAKAMALLKEAAISGEAQKKKISQATISSGMYTGNGEICHKFENAPWCNGVVFFDNSDPDIEHKAGLEYNRSDLSFELAKNEIIEKKISVFEDWESYDKGFEMDEKVFRSGAKGLVIERTDKDLKRSFGAKQTVYLNQVEAKPLVFGGYSRALNVTGIRDAEYSLYIDIAYNDNTYSWGHVIGFNAGTHDWERAIQFIYPEKPVKMAMVHALFRGEHTGTVWFDDIFLKELTDEEAGKIGKQSWDAYVDGFGLDTQTFHSGNKAIVINKSSPGTTTGARQKVTLEQQEAAPIIISGWSKAEGVTGGLDTEYSLYADITYNDGTPAYGIIASFNTATHDWQKTKITFAPNKPVKSMMLHALFRGSHTGKVWFDDISVIDSKTGVEYASDTGFENVTIVIDDTIGKDSPNLIINSGFEAGGSGLMVDGIYLDSLEGWAKERNFREEHFKYADIPLSFDPRTKEPVLLNAFSIYEFTKAISDYMHQNNRLVMANWVVIDFPYYSPLLDVAGKEVNWLSWEGLYQPDRDEDMNYRRTLSYQKPYLLLLNVHFDKFTPQMMDRYFQRSLFYGMFPSMFSFDAATDAYFENPKYYNRDRALFIKYMPIIKKISKAGWEPLTFAASDNNNIFIERYGKDHSKALYFAVHNNSDANQKALITVKKKENGLTDSRPVVIEEISGAAIDTEDSASDITFPVSLDGCQTKIFRVIKDDFSSLSGVALEEFEAVSSTLKKYEEQKKIISSEASEYVTLIGEILNGILSEKSAVSEEVRERISKLSGWAAIKGQPELLDQALRAEDSISRLKANVLKVRFNLKSLPTLVSPSNGSCEISVENNSIKKVTVKNILLRFSPELKIEDLKQEIGREIAPAAKPSFTKEVTFGVPEGLKEGAEGMLSARITCISEGKSFDLSKSVLIGIVKDIDFKLDPVKTRTLNNKPEFKVFIRNNCTAPVKGVLAVIAPDVCQPSLRQEEVEIKANGSECVIFDILCPKEATRKDYNFKVTFSVKGKSKGSEEGIISVFPKSNSLLLAPGVTVKTDSDFPGYTALALNDGIIDTTGFIWNESAWASAETPSPHWVEITFPQPQSVGSVDIYWADDNGKYWPSNKYKIECSRDDEWVLLDEVKGDNTFEILSKHKFTPVTAKKIRIWQDYSGGPKDRPDLMWIKEIEVYP